MLRGAGRLTRAIFGTLRFTKIRICLGVRGEDPAQAARTYGKLNAWLYTSLGVLDRFLFLDFEELRLLPDFGARSPPWKTGSRSGYRRGCFSSFVPPCAFFTSSLRRKSAGRYSSVYVTIALYGEYCRVHLFPVHCRRRAGEISHKNKRRPILWLSTDSRFNERDDG